MQSQASLGVAAIVLDVEAALFLFGSAPTSGAFVFAFAHRFGAGPATDGRKSLRVQRIRRHVVFADVIPNLFFAPVGERIDFNQVEFLIGADNRGGGALGRLVAANRRNPGVETGDGLLQRHDFAPVAALIRIGFIERLSGFAFRLRFGGDDAIIGRYHADLNVVFALDLRAQTQGLAELILGVEIKNVGENSSFVAQFGEHIEKDATFGAKSGRHRQFFAISLDGPF